MENLNTGLANISNTAKNTEVPTCQPYSVDAFLLSENNPITPGYRKEAGRDSSTT